MTVNYRTGLARSSQRDSSPQSHRFSQIVLLHKGQSHDTLLSCLLIIQKHTRLYILELKIILDIFGGHKVRNARLILS